MRFRRARALPYNDLLANLPAELWRRRKGRNAMSFTIERRERDGLPILAIKGRLLAGESVASLRETITELIAAGRTRIVFDCRETSYIDSSGLGCLVVAHSSAANREGHMAIYGLNRRGLELLIITKLSTVFAVFAEEIDAVNSCFPDRTARHFDILNFVQQSRAESAGS